MADTWLDLLTDAFIEIGAYAPGDTIPAPTYDVGKRWLNRMLDGWAAVKRNCYNVNFTVYTLTPSHSPTLIGPGLTSPDFATPDGASRPVRIEGANLIIGGNPATDLIINIRDDDWWHDNQVKNLTSSIPTDLYYSPAFPSGELNFWPIPTVGYQVRLEMWLALGQVDDVTAAFVAPPGYNQAILLQLALNLCGPMSKPIPPDLPGRLAKALAVIQGNNIESPRIGSADFGAGANPRRSGFNWRSGMPA